MNLYLLTNKIRDYYVFAKDPTQAQKMLERKLEEADYGFINHRKVTNIKLLATELKKDINNKPFFYNEPQIILK